MANYRIGDMVIVQKKGHKTRTEEAGVLICVGPKFVTVDLGKYRESFGYDEIRAL